MYADANIMPSTGIRRALLSLEANNNHTAILPEDNHGREHPKFCLFNCINGFPLNSSPQDYQHLMSL